MSMEVFLLTPGTGGEKALSTALMEKCLYFPYFYHRGVSRNNSIKRLILDNILLPKNSQRVYAARKDETITGYLVLEESSWDSNLLKYPAFKIVFFEIFSESPEEIIETGRLLLDESLKDLENLQHYYCLIRLDTLNHFLVFPLLEKRFILLETLVCYGAEVDKIGGYLDQTRGFFTVVPFDKDYVPMACELAATRINIYDRIHVDPIIPVETADRIMRHWVQDGVSGFYDANFKAVKNGRDVGFMLAQTQRQQWELLGINLSKLVLSAVSIEGRGAYVNLVAEAIKDLQGRGCQMIEMTTQIANRAVLRVWQSLGLRMLQSQYTLRKFHGE